MSVDKETPKLDAQQLGRLKISWADLQAKNDNYRQLKQNNAQKLTEQVQQAPKIEDAGLVDLNKKINSILDEAFQIKKQEKNLASHRDFLNAMATAIDLMERYERVVDKTKEEINQELKTRIDSLTKELGKELSREQIEADPVVQDLKGKLELIDLKEKLKDLQVDKIKEVLKKEPVLRDLVISSYRERARAKVGEDLAKANEEPKIKDQHIAQFVNSFPLIAHDELIKGKSESDKERKIQGETEADAQTSEQTRELAKNEDGFIQQLKSDIKANDEFLQRVKGPEHLQELKLARERVQKAQEALVSAELKRRDELEKERGKAKSPEIALEIESLARLQADGKRLEEAKGKQERLMGELAQEGGLLRVDYTSISDALKIQKRALHIQKAKLNEERDALRETVLAKNKRRIAEIKKADEKDGIRKSQRTAEKDTIKEQVRQIEDFLNENEDARKIESLFYVGRILFSDRKDLRGEVIEPKDLEEFYKNAVEFFKGEHEYLFNNPENNISKVYCKSGKPSELKDLKEAIEQLENKKGDPYKLPVTIRERIWHAINNAAMGNTSGATILTIIPKGPKGKEQIFGSIRDIIITRDRLKREEQNKQNDIDSIDSEINARQAELDRLQKVKSKEFLQNEEALKQIDRDMLKVDGDIKILIAEHRAPLMDNAQLQVQAREKLREINSALRLNEEERIKFQKLSLRDAELDKEYIAAEDQLASAKRAASELEISGYADLRGDKLIPFYAKVSEKAKEGEPYYITLEKELRSLIAKENQVMLANASTATKDQLFKLQEQEMLSRAAQEGTSPENLVDVVYLMREAMLSAGITPEALRSIQEVMGIQVQGAEPKVQASLVGGQATPAGVISKVPQGIKVDEMPNTMKVALKQLNSVLSLISNNHNARNVLGSERFPHEKLAFDIESLRSLNAADQDLLIDVIEKIRRKVLSEEVPNPNQGKIVKYLSSLIDAIKEKQLEAQNEAERAQAENEARLRMIDEQQKLAQQLAAEERERNIAQTQMSLEMDDLDNLSRILDVQKRAVNVHANRLLTASIPGKDGGEILNRRGVNNISGLANRILSDLFEGTKEGLGLEAINKNYVDAVKKLKAKGTAESMNEGNVGKLFRGAKDNHDKAIATAVEKLEDLQRTIVEGTDILPADEIGKKEIINQYIQWLKKDLNNIKFNTSSITEQGLPKLEPRQNLLVDLKLAALHDYQQQKARENQQLIAAYEKMHAVLEQDKERLAAGDAERKLSSEDLKKLIDSSFPDMPEHLRAKMGGTLLEYEQVITSNLQRGAVEFAKLLKAEQDVDAKKQSEIKFLLEKIQSQGANVLDDVLHEEALLERKNLSMVGKVFEQFKVGGHKLKHYLDPERESRRQNFQDRSLQVRLRTIDADKLTAKLEQLNQRLERDNHKAEDKAKVEAEISTTTQQAKTLRQEIDRESTAISAGLQAISNEDKKDLDEVEKNEKRIEELDRVLLDQKISNSDRFAYELEKAWLSPDQHDSLIAVLRQYDDHLANFLDRQRDARDAAERMAALQTQLDAARLEAEKAQQLAKKTEQSLKDKTGEATRLAAELKAAEETARAAQASGDIKATADAEDAQALRLELSEVQAQIAQLTKAQQEANEAAQAKIQEVKSAADAQLAALQAQLDAAKDEAARAKQRASLTEGDLKDKTSEATSLAAELKVAEDNARAAQASGDKKATAAEEEAEALRLQLGEIQAQVAKLIRAAQEANDAAQAKIREAENAAKAQLAALQDQLDAAKDEAEREKAAAQAARVQADEDKRKHEEQLGDLEKRLQRVGDAASAAITGGGGEDRDAADSDTEDRRDTVIRRSSFLLPDLPDWPDANADKKSVVDTPLRPTTAGPDVPVAPGPRMRMSVGDYSHAPESGHELELESRRLPESKNDTKETPSASTTSAFDHYRARAEKVGKKSFTKKEVPDILKDEGFSSLCEKMQTSIKKKSIIKLESKTELEAEFKKYNEERVSHAKSPRKEDEFEKWKLNREVKKVVFEDTKIEKESRDSFKTVIDNQTAGYVKRLPDKGQIELGLTLPFPEEGDVKMEDAYKKAIIIMLESAREIARRTGKNKIEFDQCEGCPDKAHLIEEYALLMGLDPKFNKSSQDALNKWRQEKRIEPPKRPLGPASPSGSADVVRVNPLNPPRS